MITHGKNGLLTDFFDVERLAETADQVLSAPQDYRPLGQAAVAMIRPETIRVVEAATAPLSGTIDSIGFIGDRQRMVVSGACAKPLTVEAPNTVKAELGDRVGLLIAPDAVRLLPPEN